MKIIDASKEFGCDDGVARGLIFCSRVDEAESLSQKFNEKGYRSVALSGKNNETEEN